MRTIQIQDISGYFGLANQEASIETQANHRCSFLFVKLVVKMAAFNKNLGKIHFLPILDFDVAI